MRRDPIVEEIHQIRKKMWEECGRDFDRYFDQIQADEALDKDLLVSKIAGRKKRITPLKKKAPRSQRSRS